MQNQSKLQLLNIFLTTSLIILFIFTLFISGFYLGQKRASKSAGLVMEEGSREKQLITALENINWDQPASASASPLQSFKPEIQIEETERQDEISLRDEPKVGGNEAEWQVQPDWQADWIDPDPEDQIEDKIVPEWEQMADDIDNDGIVDENDPIVVQPEAVIVEEEQAKNTGLLTAKSLDCGFELLYPAFAGGKDNPYKVYFFNWENCEFTVISWKNREEHDVFFSFIFSVKNLDGKNVADRAVEEALAWQRMFGERIFPRPLSIGGREAWLIAYNNMYTVFLHQKDDKEEGRYIQITAYDELSLQLARVIFETMRTF